MLGMPNFDRKMRLIVWTKKFEGKAERKMMTEDYKEN